MRTAQISALGTVWRPGTIEAIQASSWTASSAISWSRTNRTAPREAAVFAAGAVNAADAGASEDVNEVALNMGNAVPEGDETDWRVDHVAGEDTPEPEGCIVDHAIDGPGDELLGAPDSRMVAVVQVGAGPVPVQQGFFVVAATSTLHEERVVSGTRCAPHVVCDSRS